MTTCLFFIALGDIFDVNTMDDDLIPSASIRSVAFSFYSSTDIKNLSVKRITQQSSFDGLGLPNANGLHDPQLG